MTQYAELYNKKKIVKMENSKKSYCNQIRDAIKANPAMDYALPLYVMVRDGNIEMVKFIVEQSQCNNGALEMAMQVAAIYDHLEILKYLQLQGVNISILNEELMVIADCAAWVVLNYLIENDAPIENLTEEAKEIYYRWKQTLN